MAAVSPASTGAAPLTRASSGSNGHGMWDYPGGTSEKTIPDNHGPTLLEQAMASPLGSQDGQPGRHMNAAAREMSLADHFNSAQRRQSDDGITTSPPVLAAEPQADPPGSSDWAAYSAEERKRHAQKTLGLEYSEEDSKWIHRDKLAKIESEELQAAGFVIPRVRASSRQRRVRAQQSMDSVHSRHGEDSLAVDHHNEEPTASTWDLRTPQEIAEEEENAYFATHGLRGGTRIPVARVSPAPIPQDFLERGSPSARRIDASEGDTIAYPKTRSRSASTSTKELEAAAAGNRGLTAKRSVTEASPRKAATRKTSTASKTVKSKARSASYKDANRAAARSGESFAASYQPEGDPPWVLDSYKPDPRLPPDQQLLPTVAKRLRQEQWEKEGKFGDIYDRDFRPLNAHSFPPAQGREEGSRAENDGVQAAQGGDWPLKPVSSKSPKQTSYSTMPKISDRPPFVPTSPISPVTSPKASSQPSALPDTESHDAEPAAETEPKTKTRGGCGCCLVM